MDVAKFYISSQGATAVSSWQHVTEHCHRGNMWPSIFMKQNYDPSGNSFVLIVQRTIGHPCRTVNAPWQTWGQMAPDFGWTTFGWAGCIMDTFVILVQYWTSWPSLSYNQAHVLGHRFGSMSCSAHLAHIALWVDDQHSGGVLVV